MHSSHWGRTLDLAIVVASQILSFCFIPARFCRKVAGVVDFNSEIDNLAHDGSA
jgi:hypothetical protein